MQLIVTFRGQKLYAELKETTTVGSIRDLILDSSKEGELARKDVTLLLGGKRLQDDEQNLHETIHGHEKLQTKKVCKIMATVRSQQEQESLQQAQKTAPRVRDDLTPAGRRELLRRQAIARRMMKQVDQKSHDPTAEPYGFDRIETLPNLPQRDEAHQILSTLANDPGVLACMRKHQWNVGSLAELYPEGKVGQSAVCVMGLNKNKGQQILLRIRTDDLQGFRKMTSIRKVLYHELAHNVHSEHDNNFFQLMRQIERECLAMDWTHGEGLSHDDGDAMEIDTYQGGTYRLGGSEPSATQGVSKRELAARAAMARMTPEEQEIEENCGCGRTDLFLPKQKPTSGDGSSS